MTGLATRVSLMLMLSYLGDSYCMAGSAKRQGMDCLQAPNSYPLHMRVPRCSGQATCQRNQPALVSNQPATFAAQAARAQVAAMNNRPQFNFKNKLNAEHAACGAC